MTNNNYYNTIVPLRHDLDECIITDTSVDNADGSTTTITFHNPVTGSTDRVIFEGENPNDIQSIFYVIGYSVGRINEELIMDDLEDLYGFILIDDEQ